MRIAARRASLRVLWDVLRTAGARLVSVWDGWGGLLAAGDFAFETFVAVAIFLILGLAANQFYGW